MEIETLYAWPDDPTNADGWNFRESEVSPFWQKLWGEEWTLTWEDNIDLVTFFVPLANHLSILVETEGLLDWPAFEVEVTMEYDLLPPVQMGKGKQIPVMHGWPDGGVRTWQQADGLWIGMIAKYHGVTIKAFDPRSLNVTAEP